MTTQIESFKQIFDKRRFPQAQKAKALVDEFSQKLRQVGIPEVIEGVVLFDAGSSKYHHPDFIHDKEARIFHPKDGSPDIELDFAENRLLAEFERTPNRSRRSEELSMRVFDDGYSPGIVKRYVYLLRRKIEPDPKNPKFIVSIGHIYIFNDPSKPMSEAPVGQDADLKEEVYRHRAFTYYVERRLVVVGGEEKLLTPTENRLLHLFVRNPNRVITHKRLLEVWEDEPETEGPKDLVKVHVQRLRGKLEPDKRGKEFEIIVSERGIGYKFCVPDIKSSRVPEAVY